MVGQLVWVSVLAVGLRVVWLLSATCVPRAVRPMDVLDMFGMVARVCLVWLM